MQPRRKNGLETRELLLDLAETLFAEKGVDNITLADINRAAKQKNRNALQYHFGDKSSLIIAVLKRHREAIAKKRRVLIDKLTETSAHTLEDIIDILVTPLAEMISEGASGIAYLRINAQLMATDHYAALRRDANQWPEENIFLTQLVAAKLPELSIKERVHRELLVDCLLFHGLATFASKKPKKQEIAAFKIELMRSIVAILRGT